MILRFLMDAIFVHIGFAYGMDKIDRRYHRSYPQLIHMLCTELSTYPQDTNGLPALRKEFFFLGSPCY